ncbi:hypothetical protein AURDEDRAFT_159712 [Auricularia subglabra TFB-10046 SS5]|nr:hypothetical protein AURDEDRAFT_159712 [Auricularia subglabra TFB-10046 SS5]
MSAFDATTDPNVTVITLPASDDSASQGPAGDSGSTTITWENGKMTVVHVAPRARAGPPAEPPAPPTLEDLIFLEDIPDGPVFGLTPANMRNAVIGPVFFVPPAVYTGRGVLTNIPRPGRARGKTIWDRFCEILSTQRFPDPDSLDANGRMRLRPARTPSQVFVEPREWVKKIFVVGWLLHNPADNDTRWFFRNPDMPCLEDWVPEKTRIPVWP